ncbi:MAG: ATP-dependent DNA helicase UvrD1 [Chloroflexi bacterium]|nr:ATP-dependent DNA helicase UvrD1 [Chloroflexota bacterium]
MLQPRPSQEKILEYTTGTMGVSAVPGSGKTWTLSLLAADIIARNVLDLDQEVLIVTLVNSAVDNFTQRIGEFLKQRGLLPHLGYRVRTLHGLAHDIVRERPALVGLDVNFQIVDEREGNRIRTSAAEEWLYQHPNFFDDYLDPDFDEGKRDWVRREKLPRLVDDIAYQFIRTAKDMQLTPQAARERLDDLPIPLPLAEAGVEIYGAYQHSLAYRGAVDFDDLIRLAYQALQLDEDLLARLRHQWPYILEDEAQDSSQVQEKILRLLAQNWVRVGDPNQAIYETFTTAKPELLRDFIREADFPRTLPTSGRSTSSIISLANSLVEWTQSEHHLEAARTALAPPYIQPTSPDDHQANPPDRAEQIHLIEKGYSPKGELKAIAKSLEQWLPDHPEETVAVLVPRNTRAQHLADLLRQADIEPVETLLRSTSQTRKTAGALGNILAYLANPGSANKLASVYRVWRRDAKEGENKEVWEEVKELAQLIRKCSHVEDFLAPGPDQDWLSTLDLEEEQEASLRDFREMVERWLKTILLPIDQMILTLSQDLFTTPMELAIAHKLAVFLRQLSNAHPNWGLPSLTDELAVVARNERRFISFTSDTGFDPEAHKGKVVLTTAHKAKGLEWDRVYVISVNNYNYPSGAAYDQYISERWYVRDNLNLPAETLAQLKAAFSDDVFHWYEEGTASQKARVEYVKERLRLLYVGITRAKKELVITWNKGRRGELQPALAFVALQEDRN